MKESGFYIKKADVIINKINDAGENLYPLKYPIDQLVTETELLFHEYSENYPSLLEIKLLKEQYHGWYFDHAKIVSDKLLLLLSSFKNSVGADL